MNVSWIRALLAGASAWAAAGAWTQDTQDLERRIGIDQNLGAQVPLNLPFKDEAGRDVKLGDFFGKRPVVLTLVFYNCPGVCVKILSDLAQSFHGMMRADVGKDFEVVTVSIHPKETAVLAAETKKIYMAQYGRPQDAGGWHFLTGPESSSRALAKAVGFRYVYDPVNNLMTHPAGIMVLTPEGKVSRYFYGIVFPPKVLLPAIQAAGESQIGRKAEPLFWGCVQYDAHSHRYTLVVVNLLKVLGIATVLALGTAILVMSLRSGPKAPPEGPA